MGMSKHTHTPGPWKAAAPRGKGHCWRIWRNDVGFDESCDGNPGYARIALHVDGEANARLISAAPDLLAALAEANYELSAMVPDPENTQRGDWPEELNGADIECLHKAFVVIRAAIAKAKGTP